jgi:hypothetical protein
MSDDKCNSQGQDRQRINIHQEYELRDWSKSLGVTPEELKKAVASVGDRADKVREYLSAEQGAGYSR